MDPRAPQRLDRVDVSDAGDRALIEEQHLDRGPRPATEKRAQPRDGEAARQRLLPERGMQRHSRAPNLSIPVERRGVDDRHASELACVGEPQGCPVNETDLATDVALVHIRRASIARHATDTPPLSLDDAAVVQEGARAFSERGCVNCHGAPGVNWAKFSEGLRPDPPDLKELVDELRPQDLFWVVKHGIHMTGMPSFGLIEVPDREIWTIVAFLKKLPSVTEEDFKAWSTKP